MNVSSVYSCPASITLTHHACSPVLSVSGLERGPRTGGAVMRDLINKFSPCPVNCCLEGSLVLSPPARGRFTLSSPSIHCLCTIYAPKPCTLVATPPLSPHSRPHPFDEQYLSLSALLLWVLPFLSCLQHPMEGSYEGWNWEGLAGAIEVVPAHSCISLNRRCGRQRI